MKLQILGVLVFAFYGRNHRPTPEFQPGQTVDLAHFAPRMWRTLKSAWQALVHMLFGSDPSHARESIA